MPKNWLDQTFAAAGTAHRGGNLREAERLYKQILAQNPHHAESLNLLGVVVGQLGDPGQSVELFRRAIAVRPAAGSHANLGLALSRTGKIDEAIAAFRAAIAAKPDFLEPMLYLANLLRSRGRIDAAIDCYRQALNIRPNLASIHNDLGNAWMARKDFQEAVRSFRRSLELQPDAAEVLSNLGIALKENDQVDEAAEVLKKAVAIKPDFASAHINLANVLSQTARPDLAIESYRRGIALRPDSQNAHSNLLYAMHFSPEFDAQRLFDEHRAWAERFAPMTSSGRHESPEFAGRKSPGRRLKIGYVSPDFRSHVVGRSLLPALRHRDREAFEVICYSNSPVADAVTLAIRENVDHFVNIAGLANDAVSEMIRGDGIDILVDLSLHTANNRLMVFARKPAPLQLTYLGYCGTTGLRQIDYRLSDPYLDPPGTHENLYSESTVRLPRTYWCYQPGGAMPEVSPLPAEANGYVTFGCLNKFAKVSPQAMDVWVEVLRSVPDSRLLVHAGSRTFLSPLLDRASAAGLPGGRIEWVPRQSWDDYARTYQRIDVALDPFPFNGGITSCDAMMMGVPVVTLRGRTAVGRGGCSIVSNAGLPELIADSTVQYMNLATELAADLPRLSRIRVSLRDRMKTSPLMNASEFARDLENAYRDLWRRWCDPHV